MGNKRNIREIKKNDKRNCGDTEGRHGCRIQNRRGRADARPLLWVIDRTDVNGLSTSGFLHHFPR